MFEVCNPTNQCTYWCYSSPLPLLPIGLLTIGMRIDTMKTKEMIIRFCRDPVFLPYINIDRAAIERVSQVKLKSSE